MSRIDGDIGHRRHDPVNPKGLIAQDRRLPDRFLRRRAGRFCADVCQISRPHIAVLPVRRGHFVPLRVRLGNQHHFRIGLVGVYALCALAWLRAKVEPHPACRHLVDFRACLALRAHGHARCFARRNGDAQYSVLLQASEFARLVDWMNERHLVFAIQRLADKAAFRCKRPQAVPAKVCCVRFIDRDHHRYLVFFLIVTPVMPPVQLTPFTPGSRRGKSPLILPFWLSLPL